MTRLITSLAIAVLALFISTPQNVPAQPTPIQVPNFNNEVISHGIAAAHDYAAAHGWEDKCAGQTIQAITITNADEMTGVNVDGYANLNCSFVLDADVTDLTRLCQVAEHEALHEIRHDGWHDPDITQPLANGSTVVGPECAVYDPPEWSAPAVTAIPEPATKPFTMAQARQKARNELNMGPKWKFRVLGREKYGKGWVSIHFIASKKVKMKTHTRVRKVEILVERDSGDLQAWEISEGMGWGMG